jgi:O-methyltransferase
MNLEYFINIVSPNTMTSIERISELYHSLEYIRTNNIEGDLVECGVWKGGNIKGIIDYLDYHKMHDRKVWLYDTFSGMTEPEDTDVDLNGNKAEEILESVMCYAPLDYVKILMESSNFPKEKINYVVGDVLETLELEENIPSKISLLRLDTDWYKSTKMELESLYPKLNNSGVLIVDDYGHWKGSKQAVDEFFKGSEIKIHQIDYTGIKIIKP